MAWPSPSGAEAGVVTVILPDGPAPVYATLARSEAKMPKELFRIASGLQWRRTVIRPRQRWLETELHFEVDGRPLSVAFDSVPDREFLRRVADAYCLAIYEVTPEERLASGPDR